ncbi:type II secretion system protein F [Pseudomonas daroniae]|uniref:Type II secretion system protein F n=1 Tax=Phytopseudomonas daroniae TaxID=2487519 RepID=A0A4Q9QQ28_9GAMM|nr:MULTISPECIES: type II secretion system F family protein [Pseudomonas]TBU75412.1 type II secretion system protein F [Pseudomonas daroniae]TBU81634.1 type II secretion system protein F [Pseudomonas daroniae]TBU84202.1 type II secretion system protein F [Pseudomonas sp. FRB 228]TBU88574.1 type II secretion system protein F [Pseudomonas daroniae]
MSASLLLGLICLTLLALGLILLRKSRVLAASEQVMQRLLVNQPESRRAKSLSHLDKLFLRAGVSRPRRGMGLWLAIWLGGAVLGMLIGHWLGLLVMLLLPLIIGRLFIALRYRRRVLRMIEQLPTFLDHVIRSLKSGRTLGDALLLAMENAPDPLRGAMGRTRRNVQRGMGLGDALQDFADLYEREEFQVLALGVRVNQRYGGNSSELLQNLIRLIREREQSARKLRALTGETRISAYVMGGLPLALASYIFLTNPDFMLGMWQEPTGRMVLLLAFVLQALGSIALWRMLRSL